jgi:hypothetical protein
MALSQRSGRPGASEPVAGSVGREWQSWRNPFTLFFTLRDKRPPTAAAALLTSLLERDDADGIAPQAAFFEISFAFSKR